MLDMSYYKGKLYVYYGVTPALLLFWPFVALTGHYLFHKAVDDLLCHRFSGQVCLLWALWRRYFTEVSVGVVVACVLALGLATGVPVLLPRSDIYEVAISCGYMLTMLALGAIWRAMDDRSGGAGGWRRRVWRTDWRWGRGPNLLFGAVILLVPVALAWRGRRQVWAPLMAAIGPIVLIGLALMLYNARRFGSPLEFGWSYLLPENGLGDPSVCIISGSTSGSIFWSRCAGAVVSPSCVKLLYRPCRRATGTLKTPMAS